MSAQTVQGWRPDDASFGARLALIRQRMGWGDVKEAALACGQPVESWRSWERDGRMPRDYIRICQDISLRTGVDVVWLAGVSVRELATAPASTSPEARTESQCTPGLAQVIDFPTTRIPLRLTHSA